MDKATTAMTVLSMLTLSILLFTRFWSQEVEAGEVVFKQTRYQIIVTCHMSFVLILNVLG